MPARNHYVSLAEPQHHVINPTNPCGALDDGVEHRLHVGGGAADDAEHLSGCCLMLQGFTQFCISLLDLLEQPHVFDRDHRLIGEGSEESNLFFGKRPNFGSADLNRAMATPSRSNGVKRTVRVPVT